MNGSCSPKRTEYTEWSSPKATRKHEDEGNVSTKQQYYSNQNCFSLQRTVILVLVVLVLCFFFVQEAEITSVGSVASLVAIGATYKGTLVENDARSEDLVRVNSTSSNSRNHTAIRASKTLPLSTIADVLPDLLPQQNTPSNETQHSISSVYSMEAMSRLDRIKTKLVKGDSVTLVMNGGSSSAGAPGITFDDRFFVQMVHRLEKDYPKANIKIVDRSHGARNTMHSAHLMHTLFPAHHIDIVIWEFSINDGSSEADVRNQLIHWLRNLEAYQKDDPPSVIMVYLWQSPFHRSDVDGRIACRTFDQHNLLPAEYGFVLGHVHLGAYMDSLRWDFDRLNSTFLADRHHPTALTHHVLGKLLHQFITHASSIRPVRNTPPTKKTDLEWNCKIHDKTNKVNRQHETFVRDLIVTERRVVAGSYTVDVPRNEPLATTKNNDTITTTTRTSIPGMLIPNENVTLKMFGKAIKPRRDRQYGMILPCCRSTNTTETETMSSSFISFHVGQDRYIHALELTLRVRTERRSDIHIMYDGIQTASPTRTDLIRPSEWNCLLGGYNMGIGDFPKLDVDFVMVKRNVTTLAFCDVKCTVEDPLPMVSLSIY